MAIDRALTKAPLGGEVTGPNPTDRAQSGGKRSLLTDGNGIPLAVVLAPANRHDVKLFEAMLEGCRVLPPVVSQHLCLDKRYDSAEVRETAHAYLFTPHVRPVGEEPRRMERHRKRKPRRWAVERTHAWMNRLRRLWVRWERKVRNPAGFVAFACALIARRACGIWSR